MSFDSYKIFSINKKFDFKNICMKIFNYQFDNNFIYNKYCNLIGVKRNQVNEITDIPFIPISLFKKHKISTKKKYQKVFYSSGTTKKNYSKHYIHNLKIYEKSFIKNFEINYGDLNECIILALLPTYYENKSSSLLYMVNKLIKKTKSNESGFYLEEYDKLSDKLKKLEKKNKKIILIGVTYALLDLIEYENFNLKKTIIMETGGMKGKRKEIIKDELHEILKLGFGVNYIHSEYGMTELLSQAYSKKNGIFKPPPWMKVFTRDLYDFKNIDSNKRTGPLNIIDLANYYSCSFIATDDIGTTHKNFEFEVLGRMDESEIRGCNLMI
tara:strand:+ start:152 stop:1129 length:978 start_codon:yes stop_codon:yes gene_type:complete